MLTAVSIDGFVKIDYNQIVRKTKRRSDIKLWKIVEKERKSMKWKTYLKRSMSLLVAVAMVCGLLVPAFAATAGTGTKAASQEVSVAGKAYSENQNAYEIYPVPHSAAYPTDGQPFTMTSTVNVVAGEGVDAYTTEFLKEILEQFGFTMSITNQVNNSQTNIILSIHGGNDAVSPSAYSDLFTASDKYDPYLLKAEAGSNRHGLINIIGKNADCVYYGVATLQMMFTSFHGERFLPVQIEDYSNTIFRGFIEGFYGGFTYAGRESQIRSIRDVKGNMYAFASKTDEYHGGSKWNELYPADELAQIKNLVDVGLAMKVKYTWSIHIGKAQVLGANGTTISDELYAQRLTQLKAKFQQLYDVGVRSFNILNDDYNSGTHATQVRLLNDINAWLKEKGDCAPLIYCCAGYNTSWAGDGSELRDLQALDEDIYLYWTGALVNSPINQENVGYPYELSKHQVVTWLNYPCSEHDKAGIYLGEISHYVSEADGLVGQVGLMSNPVNYPEANKVAYFQLLSWAWNRDHYTGYLNDLWEDSFKYLQPEVYDAYLTIARNVSNCPDSSRVSAFPESEYLKDVLSEVQTKLLQGDTLDSIPNAQKLLDEFDHILASVEAFRKGCANTALVTELDPWLKSLTGVATAGKNAMLALDALATDDLNKAWTCFAKASLGLSEWNAYPTPEYANVKAKAGSRRLQPFADALVSAAEEQLQTKLNPNGAMGGGTPSLYAVMGGTQQKDDANSGKMFDKDNGSYTTYQIVQKQDDYYGVDLGGVKLVNAIDILQGKTDSDHDYFHNAALECSVNGRDWVTLVSKVNSTHIRVDDLSLAARYVRLRLVKEGYNNKPDYWTFVREFTVTTAETAKEDLIDTNLTLNEGDVTVSLDGGAYTLTANRTLTLPSSNGYVGLRLPEITGIQAVTLSAELPAGVKLQYSPNGVVWTDGAPTHTAAMRFIRLINTSNGAVTLNGFTLTAARNVRTELSYVSTNMGTYQSTTWADMVDGDRATFVWTDAKQTEGQYVIYDLSGMQPVHDVTLYFPESGDYPHYLDISIGNTTDPDGAWTSIGTFDNQPDMTPPYRYYACDGEGQTARYIKLEITQTDTGWIKFNELEVNKDVVEGESVGAISGTAGRFQNVADGNFSTFYVPAGNGAGHLEYLLPELTPATAVTILQDPAHISGGSLSVQLENGTWSELGTLDKSMNTFPLTGGILALRLEWTVSPAIAEIILEGVEQEIPGGEIPTLVPNIYMQPSGVNGVTVENGTAIADVPLPAQVSVQTSGDETVSVPVTWTCETYGNGTVAGTYHFIGTLGDLNGTLSNPGCFTLTAVVTVKPGSVVDPPVSGDPEKLVSPTSPAYASGCEEAMQTPDKALDGLSDEDSGHRWNSNYMKVKADKPAWFVVDLGENVTSITSITMDYFKKVWPSDYKIQVAGSGFTPVDYCEENGAGGGTMNAATFTGDNAEDAACWTTIKTVSGAVCNDYPVITIDEFDASIPAGTRYLRIYFTAMNSAAAGHAVGLRELTVMGTRKTTEPPAPTLESISLTPSSLSVDFGTAFDRLGLPEQATAKFSDGSSVTGTVAWDSASYHANQSGAQTVTGTLTLPNGDTYPVSIQVTVGKEPDIPVTQYTVTFTGEGVETKTVTVAAGAALGAAFPEDPVREGYTFVGWYAGETQFTAATVVNGNLTVVARWTANTYTLTYTIDGESVHTEQYATGAAVTAWTAPEREGYTFSGWSGLPQTMPAHDVTVSGSYTANPVYYVVTFQNNGTVVELEVLAGETLGSRMPADPTREGYTFDGWFAGDGTAFRSDTPVTASITVTARWTEVSVTPPAPPSKPTTPSDPDKEPDKTEPDTTGTFTDVSPDSWYAEPVAYVQSKGYMKGR